MFNFANEILFYWKYEMKLLMCERSRGAITWKWVGMSHTVWVHPRRLNVLGGIVLNEHLWFRLSMWNIHSKASFIPIDSFADVSKYVVQLFYSAYDMPHIFHIKLYLNCNRLYLSYSSESSFMSHPSCTKWPVNGFQWTYDK